LVVLRALLEELLDVLPVLLVSRVELTLDAVCGAAMLGVNPCTFILPSFPEAISFYA
jgi:hypothetical protein